jgi:hypothetical protein
VLATRKQWQVVRFIGLISGLMAAFVLIERTYGFSAADELWAVAVLLTVGFLAYLIIPVLDGWRGKKHIESSDIVLLSINIVGYYLAFLWYWDNAADFKTSAFITAFFALCCLVMAIITERRKRASEAAADFDTDLRSLSVLFFITGVTFTALIVPFALDSAWFFLGWLIQGTGLLLYGILFSDRYRNRFCVAGSVIGSLCLLSFVLDNVPNYQNALFTWQYLSVTLAGLAVAVATMRLKPGNSDALFGFNLLRGIAAFNGWLYVIFALYRFVPDNALAYLLSVTVGLGYAFAMKWVKRWLPADEGQWQGFDLAGLVMGVCGTVGILRFNAVHASGLAESGSGTGIVAFILYIFVNLFAVLWMNTLLNFLINLRRLSAAFYPLAISGFFVLLTVQNLVVQLSLRPSSLVLTLVFGLAALGWIWHGFVKLNGITRISGLSMAFFAVLKLFILDLHGLDTVWRIVSYFTAGVVLLAISFTYQWYSKRIERE